MTSQPYGSGPEPSRPPRRPQVNGGRLWAGGVATALVAALVGLVGLVVVRGLFDIPVWLPGHDGTIVDATAGRLALLAALAAIVATGLLHLLLLTTPSPLQFFGWFIGLATVAAALWPFLTQAHLDSKIAGAAIFAVIGIAIGSSLSAVAGSAIQPGR